MTAYVTRPVEVLYVEDNELDAESLQRALDRLPLEKKLHHVEDGETALKFLQREEEFKEAPRPDLILLDLNMPGIDGHQVLRHIKEDSDLRTIPVVILTTSSSLVDITRAYSHFANGFLTKPFAWEETVEAIGAMSRYWFSIVRLPPKPDESPIQPDETLCEVPQECAIQMLYVEDDKLDAEAMVEAARETGFTQPVQVVTSAEDALHFLRKEEPFGEAPSADLVILDFNLPGKTGLEFLKEIRNGSQLSLRRAPIMMLTQFDQEQMVLEAYRAYVNAFVSKPANREGWKQTMCAIAHWCKVAQLPSRPEQS